MGLAELGTRPAVTCADSAVLEQVAREMVEHDIGAIVVVGTDGLVVGIVTDRDLVVRGLAHGKGPDTRVSDVMSREVASVADTASATDAARQMATRVCRRLPVLDDHGRLLAVVSADDLVRHDSEMLEHLGDLLSRQAETSPLT